jgi:RNA polymerase sigma factor (sigma-70 family)
MSADPDLAYDPEPMRDNPVVALVMRARTGDKRAWDALVERYAPLVWSLCRRYRLDAADTADVGQNVWLQLVSHLGKIRDPAAIPGWLATTTRRECERVLNTAQARNAARYAPDAENIPDDQATTIDQGLLETERHAALREAFAHLPLCCQKLIALLIEDPPVRYAEISTRLGTPVGSIGPNRRRCLDKLRHHPAIAALIDAEAQTADRMRLPWGGHHGDVVLAEHPSRAAVRLLLGRHPAVAHAHPLERRNQR